MKKLLLHIGRHKTGTSSLQVFLYKNRKKLMADGIYYPKTGMVPAAHHKIGNALMTNESAPLIIKELLSEIEQCQYEKILMSSESFQNLRPERVKEFFGNFDVEIILYLRNQIDYLASAYAQEVHATYSIKTLENFANGPFLEGLNYLNYLYNWESVFQNKVRVSLFDRQYLHNGDIIDDFCVRFLQLSDRLHQYRRNKNFNYSLGASTLAFKLKLNEYVDDITPLNEFLYFALESISLERGEADKFVLPKNFQERLINEFSDSNHQVSSKYLDGYPIIPSAKKMIENNSSISLSNDEFIRAYKQLAIKSYALRRFVKKYAFPQNCLLTPDKKAYLSGLFLAIIGDLKSILRLASMNFMR